MADTANSVPVVIVDRYSHGDYLIDHEQYPNSVVFSRGRRLHEDSWHKVFKSQKLGDHTPLNYLEIGCQEGSGTFWFLENYLGHPDSRVTVIDKFMGTTLDNRQHNLAVTKWDEKVDVRVGLSGEVLRQFPLYSMDVIYIDGLHSSYAVIEDATLCWRLLKEGGILIFDDYRMNAYEDPMDRPAPAIDFFMQAYHAQYQILDIGAQVALKKTYPDSKEDHYVSLPLERFRN